MGAGAARGPMYPSNLSDDVVWRPTYSSFQRGGRWQRVSTKATPSERCQDGRLQHCGYQGNQSLLLTAAFVGWQPRETKCHFLPLYRHMHNHPPFGLSSWISNYSIIKWKSSSRWQSTTTSSCPKGRRSEERASNCFPDLPLTPVSSAHHVPPTLIKVLVLLPPVYTVPSTCKMTYYSHFYSPASKILDIFFFLSSWILVLKKNHFSGLPTGFWEGMKVMCVFNPLPLTVTCVL